MSFSYRHAASKRVMWTSLGTVLLHFWPSYAYNHDSDLTFDIRLADAFLHADSVRCNGRMILPFVASVSMPFLDGYARHVCSCSLIHSLSFGFHLFRVYVYVQKYHLVCTYAFVFLQVGPSKGWTKAALICRARQKLRGKRTHWLCGKIQLLEDPWQKGPWAVGPSKKIAGERDGNFCNL